MRPLNNSMDSEEKQKQKNSVLYWIRQNEIKNEQGELIRFDDHKFMIDIYSDILPIQVIRKGSQVGASTMEILRSLHDARFWGINQIYTLPTVDDVAEFVKSKVNRIIKVNPCMLEGVSGKDVDSVEQKQIGKSFLFFKGTYTEKEAIMLTSDRNIHDELDKSKPEVIRDYTSRMGFSKIRSQHYFSTPTIPGIGIDALWAKSDQKHWRFNCPHCRYKQHMEWDKNVDRERKIYVCQKCRNKITSQWVNDNGEWEVKYPGEEISGYWINQMMCPWRTCADLLKEEADAQDEQYFYNFVLGMPYIAADQKIPQSLFLRNITSESAELSGWNVMGADTGDENHIVIGNSKGIFWIGKIKDNPGKTRWEYMAELIQFYDVRVCVIDGMPWTEEALRLARKFPYRVFLNFYKDDPKMLEAIRWNDEQEGDEKPFEDEIKVLVSRNRIIDDTISALHRGEIKFAMKPDDISLKMLISHTQTMYARTVTNQHGQEKREWESTTGADHAWHALLYWHIALKKRFKYEPNR